MNPIAIVIAIIFSILFIFALIRKYKVDSFYQDIFDKYSDSISNSFDKVELYTLRKELLNDTCRNGIRGEDKNELYKHKFNNLLVIIDTKIETIDKIK